MRRRLVFRLASGVLPFESVIGRGRDEEASRGARPLGRHGTGVGAGFIPANLNTKILDETIPVKEEDSGPVSKEDRKSVV